MKKVVVGLSGGVDSAVACYLLKQKGYEVEAIFMQNWDSFINHENYDNQKEKCDAQYEWEDAKKIADVLGVKISKVDFIKEYWDYVFSNFIAEYKKGHTPNPDVLCNKYIKFGCFLKYAFENMKCDFIATGHYANKKNNKYGSLLKMAKDKNKDQTYFLCQLSEEQVNKSIFPLARLTKKKVRKIANKIGLDVWNKKDSTGICFIGERNFKQFMKNYLPEKPGDIIDIDSNVIIGKHEGIVFYTIGQNSKLNLGGMKTKYYVCKKDVDNNILYVCSEDKKNKYLLSKQAIINQFNWINPKYIPKTNQKILVRFRHRQKLIKCHFEINKDKSVKLIYKKGQFAVTQGQYAVLYHKKICLGGGVIDNYVI